MLFIRLVCLHLFGIRVRKHSICLRNKQRGEEKRVPTGWNGEFMTMHCKRDKGVNKT